MPTSWSDFPSHADVPKLIPNPLAVDNVSVENVPFVGEGGIYILLKQCRHTGSYCTHY